MGAMKAAGGGDEGTGGHRQGAAVVGGLGEEEQNGGANASSSDSNNDVSGGAAASGAEARGGSAAASAGATTNHEHKSNNNDNSHPAPGGMAVRLERDQSFAFLQQLRRKKLACIDDIKALRAQLQDLDGEISVERERLGVDDPEAQRRAVLEQGIARFNEKPKAGIVFLKENCYFHKDGSCTPEDIATLLLTADLAKPAIGEYLGENKPENLKVLDAFVGLHDFVDTPFEEALRQFLTSFRLPGESQKIDRMMEAFASRFCECNSGIFKTTDGGYVLAFATIMLNTSLHNPAVKNPPTLEQFVSMNRGIDGGDNIPRPVLEEIYASVAQTPFKDPEDDGGLSIMFFNPEHQGWLKKEGGSKKTWRMRWVVLKNQCLYYFKHKDDDAPCGIVPLESAMAQPTDVTKKRSKDAGRDKELPATCYFEVVSTQFDQDGKRRPVRGCKTNSKGMVVAGNHQRYLFRAANVQDAADWVARINGSTDMFSMLQHKIGAKRAGAEDAEVMLSESMFDTSREDSMFVTPLPAKTLSHTPPPSSSKGVRLSQSLDAMLTSSGTSTPARGKRRSMEASTTHSSTSSVGTNISIRSQGSMLPPSSGDAALGRAPLGDNITSILEECDAMHMGDDDDMEHEETTV